MVPFLCSRGDGRPEGPAGPAGETSDPGNMKTEVSEVEVSDQGDTLGEHGPDFRDISEEIFSLHSFFKLV